MQEANKVSLMSEPSLLALASPSGETGPWCRAAARKSHWGLKTAFNICAGLLERSDLASLVLTIPSSRQPVPPRTVGELRLQVQINRATEKCFLLLYLKQKDSQKRRYGWSMIKACKKAFEHHPRVIHSWAVITLHTVIILWMEH